MKIKTARFLGCLWKNPMETKKNKMTAIGDIISNIFNDPKLPISPDNAKIWKIWDDAVGPIVAKHARPVRIWEGTLRVRVWDPIWLQELRLIEKSIKEKLNEKLGQNKIEKIEFKLEFR